MKKVINNPSLLAIVIALWPSDYSTRQVPVYLIWVSYYHPPPFLPIITCIMNREIEKKNREH